MMLRSSFPMQRPERSDGFSLIELLVVVAIIAILSALAVPAVTSQSEALRTTQAAETVVAQLNLARREATTRNRPVEVRFCRVESNPRTDAVWLLESRDDGTFVPLGRPAKLPQAVLASESQTLNSLLILPEVTSPTNPMPGHGTAYSYRAFSYLGDGSTTLFQTNQPADGWFVTILSERHATNSTAPPNFATFAIEPLTGAIRAYRP